MLLNENFFFNFSSVWDRNLVNLSNIPVFFLIFKQKLQFSSLWLGISKDNNYIASWHA